jgi:hypothetical protein
MLLAMLFATAALGLVLVVGYHLSMGPGGCGVP